MSAKYMLTPRAAEDLDAIADYTIDTWGLDQLDSYLRSLDRRFEWLAENPQQAEVGAFWPETSA